MKLKIISATFAISILPSFGAVTLIFSDFDGSVYNRSDSVSASAVNDLAWGIVVDNNGDNFTSPLEATGLSLTDGANLGNGYELFLGEGLTAQSVSILGVQQGAVSLVTDLDIASKLNKRFAIIWFDGGAATVLNEGQKYGLDTNSNLILPNSNSGNFSYTGFYATSQDVANTTLALVPEPSTALLGLLGLAGLLRRKR